VATGIKLDIKKVLLWPVVSMIIGAAASELMHRGQYRCVLCKEINMNENNYCSLEMSKKLVDAGIVLGTEAHWIKVANSPLMLRDSRYGADEHYPAPSMIELWRELPEELPNNTRTYYMKLMIEKSDEMTLACYGNDNMETYIGEYESISPANALAELLIWVKEEKI
jgi:hypothetical protein